MPDGAATIDTAEPVTPNNAAAASHDRSTIGFPYGDLDDGISVAQGIMACGGMPCAPDQLAAALKQTPTSGAFKGKVATARIFGLIETIQNKYQLTELGFAITDAGREKAARADAFLKVPLYRKVYEEFRNKQLPPRPVALEHAFVGLGVAAKQKDKARYAFDRSAQQAGYFDQGGRDRLIRPPVASLSSDISEVNRAESDTQTEFGGTGSGGGWNGGGNGGGNLPRGRMHPFIQGLLDTLPEPNTNWAEEGRAKWLQAAANIFDLMYMGDAHLTVHTTKRD
jgi:hypothetical protein